EKPPRRAARAIVEDLVAARAECILSLAVALHACLLLTQSGHDGFIKLDLGPMTSPLFSA
ncbi:MAG: hypothetical protein WAN68_07805, partial [Pseudolabrys sp.]